MPRASSAGGSAKSVEPYRRSWIDALIDFIERIPGPTWIFYLLVTLVFVAGGTGLRWLDGTLALGTFSAPRIVLDLLTVFGLVAIHVAKKIAQDSLETFRPALGDLEPAVDTLRYELTTMSRSAGFFVVVVSIVFTSSSLLADLEAWDITPSTSPGVAGFFVTEALIDIVFFVAFVSFAYRQVRTVMRIHRAATQISLLESSARNGFSTLTLTLSILVALPIYLSSLSYAIAGVFFVGVSVIDLAGIAVVLTMATLVFVVPLYGLHRRLAQEKANALMTVGASFSSTTQELHSRIAQGTFDQLGGVNTALTSLVIERDALRRASTWPWEVETLRGFLSSVALPIALWLVTALLGRVIGA